MVIAQSFIFEICLDRRHPVDDQFGAKHLVHFGAELLLQFEGLEIVAVSCRPVKLSQRTEKTGSAAGYDAIRAHQ